MQETICDKFVINDDYLNSIPRPSIDEFNALKMKIIEKGQQEPIIVNSDMVILDGHTRYKILSERGMSINYMVRDFANKQEEFEYVVETNIMRRQLNNFQKLEALYRLYVGKKTEKNYNLWIMILESIKQGNITRKRIASDIGYTDEAVGKTLKVLTEKYFIKKEKQVKKYNMKQGGSVYYEYHILPKTEEFLSKNKKKEVIGANKMITNITGLNRNTVSMGMALIERADSATKKKLRNGVWSITTVYKSILGRKDYKRKGGRSKKDIQCPHCKHIINRSDLK